MLKCVVLSSFIIFASGCSLDPKDETSGKSKQPIGIDIPTAITATALDGCAKTAFMTVDGMPPAIPMVVTDTLATITLTGLSLGEHQFSIEFKCNNSQFPEGISLASQSLSLDVLAGENKLDYPADQYNYADMDTDGFTNLSEIVAKTNPNDSGSQPILGANLKVSDIVTSATHRAPLLVFNDAADGLAIWEVNSGTGNKILYSVYTFVNNQWSAEALLAAQASSSTSMAPQVSTNGSQFAVVWKQINDDETLLSINSKFYSNGNWGTVLPLASYEGGSSETAKIASNGSGYAVVWQQSDLNVSNIYANVFNGSSWQSTPAQLELLPEQASLPALSSNSNGYMAVWKQQDAAQNEPFNIYANYYDGSTWQTNAERIEQRSGDVTNDPQIAAQGNRFATIWLQKQAGVNDVNVSVYNNNTWINPRIIDSTQGLVLDPRIVSNQNSFSIAWKQVDPKAGPIAVELFSRLNF